MIGVEDDPERIRVGQAGIAPGVAGDDPVRVAVVEHGPDVDRIVVEKDPDFGPFGGGLPLEGVRLDEVRQRFRGRPDVLVQAAVDGRRLDRWRGPSDADSAGGFIFGPRAGPGREKQGAEGEQG